MRLPSQVVAVVTATLATTTMAQCFDLDAEIERFLELENGAMMTSAEFASLLDELYPGMDIATPHSKMSQSDVESGNWSVSRDSKTDTAPDVRRQIECFRYGSATLDSLRVPKLDRGGESAGSMATHIFELILGQLEGGTSASLTESQIPEDAAFALYCIEVFSGTGLPVPSKEAIPTDLTRWFDAHSVEQPTGSPLVDWRLFGFDPQQGSRNWSSAIIVETGSAAPEGDEKARSLYALQLVAFGSAPES